MHWKAPELFKLGGKHSYQSDVYSLGIFFWELVAAKVPYEDAEDDIQIKCHVQSGGREQIPSYTPPWFAEIISHCWHQDPNCRPPIDKIVEYLEENDPNKSSSSNSNDNSNNLLNNNMNSNDSGSSNLNHYSSNNSGGSGSSNNLNSGKMYGVDNNNNNNNLNNYGSNSFTSGKVFGGRVSVLSSHRSSNNNNNNNNNNK